MAVTVELNHDWLNKMIACTKYINSYVNSQSEPVYRGLFRVPASSTVLASLKSRIIELDATEGSDGILQCLHSFFEDGENSQDREGSINAIASLLKWIIREFPQPLIPFDYSTEDVKEKKYETVVEENERGTLGVRFAQDLILHMATHLGHYGHDSEVIAHSISAVSQLLTMLCTVSRVESVEMSSYNLFVVFLPSLCNSRDPMTLASEHKQLMGLNALRTQVAGESSSSTGGMPKSRLEIFILYGHRIWGYTEHSLPSLVLALDTISEMAISPEEENNPEGHHRKRDILKRLLNKMRGKSIPDDKSEKHSPGKFRRLFKKHHKQNEPEYPPAPPADDGAQAQAQGRKMLHTSESSDLEEYEERLGELSQLAKSPKFGKEHVKRMGIARAESVSLPSSVPVGTYSSTSNIASNIAAVSSNEAQSISVENMISTKSTSENDVNTELGKEGVRLLRSAVSKPSIIDKRYNSSRMPSRTSSDYISLPSHFRFGSVPDLTHRDSV